MYGTIRRTLPPADRALLLVYARDGGRVARTGDRRRPLASRGDRRGDRAGHRLISAHLLPTAERQSRYRPDEFFMAARAYYERATSRMRTTSSRAPSTMRMPDPISRRCRRGTRISSRSRSCVSRTSSAAMPDAATCSSGSRPSIRGCRRRAAPSASSTVTASKADEGQRHFARAETLGAESLAPHERRSRHAPPSGKLRRMAPTAP